MAGRKEFSRKRFIPRLERLEDRLAPDNLLHLIPPITTPSSVELRIVACARRPLIT